MRKIALILLVALALALSFYLVTAAQQPSPKASAPAKEPIAETQWEYLIVSGGTVNLSTAGNEQYGSMRKQPDSPFSREAFALERNLDKLGAKGWELIAVAGVPNDPIFYLKRPKEAGK